MLSKRSNIENVDLPLIAADLLDDIAPRTNTTFTDNIKTNECENSTINRKMLSSSITNYSREIVCLFALILTTYAGIQNRYSKTANLYQPSNPLPIFGNQKGQVGSPYIQEWPKGMLSAVQTRVTVSEISVILFYAPWCANSHFVISSYESIAKIFYKEIYFAAVNCWQPGGDCRLQHSKVKTWPVIVVYLSKGLAVQYNGPLQLRPLYKFINSMLNPIERLHSFQELTFLQSLHDIIVVGLFRKIDFKYQTYYQVALKWHEYDYFQDVIKFSVVTGENIKEFHMKNTNDSCIRLYIANMPDKVIEECRSNWLINEMIIWLRENTKLLPTTWYNLNVMERNNSLKNYIKKGPTLLYFTTRDYLNNDNAYNILRTVLNSDIKVCDISNTSITSMQKFPKLQKSLSYHLLDINIFHKFAEKLGINISKANSYNSMSTVVIIDNTTESIHHMKKSYADPVTVNNLKNFINNFQQIQPINQTLTRTLRTKPVNLLKIVNKNMNEIHIPEINQKQFHQIVKNSKNQLTTTIILITSTSCPVCQMFLLNLLKISRIFTHHKSIEFYKLNGNENDLVWHYTMATYPTLLIFPKINKSDSDVRIFPTFLKPDEKNIFGFILSSFYDEHVEQLKLILKYCSSLIYGFANCVKKSRLIILDIINDKLKLWNIKSNNSINRQNILKDLNNLNLLFYSIVNAKNSNNLENIDIYLNGIS